MSYLPKQRIRNRQRTSDKTTHTSYALYFFMTWGTERGLPLISPEVEEALARFFVKKCKELEIDLLKQGTARNRVHMLLSLKPTHYLPDVIQSLKGSSSHFVNHEMGHDEVLYWERGYDVRTVSKSHLDAVRRYIDIQKERHGSREGRKGR